MIKDSLTTFNERIKLFVNFLNAISLGLIGFAFLRPLVNGDLIIIGKELETDWNQLGDKLKVKNFSITYDDKLGEFLKSDAPSIFTWIPSWALWSLVGLVIHLFAHYMLGQLRKVPSHDDV